MKQIRTEVEIEASEERVWEVLTDLASYHRWNPLIPQANGKIEVGGQLELQIHAPGLLSRTFRVTVLEVEPKRVFRWLGKVLIRGLLDGDHTFIIEKIATNRVRLLQYEKFTGLLVPLCAHWLVPKMRCGFEAMNHALKTHAEQLIEFAQEQ